MHYADPRAGHDKLDSPKIDPGVHIYRKIWTPGPYLTMSIFNRM